MTVESAAGQSGTDHASAEARERVEARNRAAARVGAASPAAGRASLPPEPADGPPSCGPDLAFSLLADNVRDYAIFLLDRDGVIRYWGEGARLMKWWTK